MRETSGKCKYCRRRVVWQGAPLLREALCPRCMQPLERTSTQLNWPVLQERARTSKILAVQWKDEDSVARDDGTTVPIGPMIVVYDDGRREDKGWTTRPRAEHLAAQHRAILEVF